MFDKDKILKRKKFERLDVSFRVNISLKEKRGKTYTAICNNIGGRGLRFTIEKKLKLNETLELKIFIPDGQSPIHANGVVVWVNERFDVKSSKQLFDTGIEFVMIKFHDRNRIHKFIYLHVKHTRGRFHE